MTTRRVRKPRYRRCSGDRREALRPEAVDDGFRSLMPRGRIRQGRGPRDGSAMEAAAAPITHADDPQTGNNIRPLQRLS